MHVSRLHLALLAASSILSFQTASSSFAAGARYSWMLPKTVIDTTIVYTFDGCYDADHPAPGMPAPPAAELHLKITPTLIPRPVADSHLGRLGIQTSDLQSFWADQNITIKTFAGSHILTSIGSAPANQAGQIAGNILGGVTKLVAVGLGVPAVAAAGPPPANPPAKSKCGSANDTLAQIKDAQKSIKDLETALGKGADDTTQKKDTAQIQALQTLITALQADLTLTIKKTVDPGYSPIDVNHEGEEQVYYNGKVNPLPIDSSGLVARFSPTDKQLTDAHWYADTKDVSDTEKKLLDVTVYLDFSDAFPPITPNANGEYVQTEVGNNNIYRDVAYIPISVWRGQRPAGGQKPGQVSNPNGTLGAFQLNPAQAIAFGQYGAERGLPLQADAFKNLNWSITFLEDGEVTDATFSSKSPGVAMTGLFGNVASTANSIATEVRSATSASGEATALQSQADAIYERNRLALCQASPSSCPSK